MLCLLYGFCVEAGGYYGLTFKGPPAATDDVEPGYIVTSTPAAMAD